MDTYGGLILMIGKYKYAFGNVLCERKRATYPSLGSCKGAVYVKINFVSRALLERIEMLFMLPMDPDATTLLT